MNCASIDHGELRALSFLENVAFDIKFGCWLADAQEPEITRIRVTFAIEYVCVPLMVKAEYYGSCLSRCLLSQDRCVNPFHCVYLTSDGARVPDLLAA